MHVTSILILYLQKLFGSQFLLPEKYRTKSYNYFQIVEDLEAEGDIDCAICLNKLCQPESTNSQESNVSQNLVYMKTP